MKGKRKKVKLEKNRERYKLHGYACTETMRFSITISCVCLKRVHAGKSALATGPRHLHANPETAVQTVARAGIYSEAVKKGDL